MVSDRITILNLQLQDARYKYYVLSDPDITDEEYDTLELELRRLVEEYPEHTQLAPVLFEVGSDLPDQTKRVEHITPMLSMDNCFTITDLHQWIKGIVDQYPEVWFTIEPKVDGASLALTYESLRLTLALSRGGEDVTKVIEASGAVPLMLDRERFPSTPIEVRGEVWISKAQMNRLNDQLIQEGKKPYTSQRNLAAGSLKLKDSKEALRRGIRFHPWDCFGIPEDYLKQKSKSIQWRSHSLKYLEENGFGTCKHTSIQGTELLKNLQAHIDRARETREVFWHGDGIGMLSDGLALKVDTPEVRLALGDDGHYPAWARAYKFQDSRGETELIGIEWSCGRTGRLTPVGILEPIVLNGATITRVMLNNITWLEEMKVDHLPCRVELVRSGEIIPKITKVIHKES